MAGKVVLKAAEGPVMGQEFSFEEHDTFIFGRSDDCHACLPREDQSASRHHFMIEVNPPAARLRDLGSLNGTFVNGTKCGGRKRGQGPEEGALERFPEVDLKHGDRVSVGKTVFTVHVEAPPPEPAPRLPASLPQAESSETDPMEVLARMIRAAAGKRDEGAPTGIPGYEVERQLGAGGMGAVYLARRKKDKLPVAIKVMLAKVAVDEGARQSFLREMAVTKSLRHKNIVEFFDCGSSGSGFYMVMGFCPGGSIADLIEAKGGKLPLKEAADLFLQALDGLAFAHQQGYVHRDLKPPNILLSARSGGVAQVSDFGLAKNFEKAGLSGFTATGQSAGSPVFMPREQVTNYKYVKPASDVWSMAATFYYMVTGQFPRNFERGVDPIAIILGQSPVPLRKRDPSLPAKVASVIDKALSDKATDRFADATEFREALQQVL